MPKISIIIPTYNEKANIAELTRRIFEQNIPDLNLIFVDDGSPDGTAEEIRQYSEINPISLIQRESKLGLGSAYITGFKYALKLGADYIMEMDADLSHAPEDIPRLIMAASNADLVIGSRKIKGGKIIGWNLWRHLMSNGAMMTAKILLGLKTKDITSGYRCFKRQTLEKINLDAIKSNGYAFQEEMLFRVEKLGLRVSEVPVAFTDRANGNSKLSGKDIIEFFKVMIRLI